jgi:hypothetical protein
LKTAYVKCKVLPGLFETEYYVLVNGTSATFVNRANVDIKSSPEHRAPVDGRVFVYIINRKRHKSLVEFIGEPVVGGLRTWVPNTLFASA